MSEMSKFEARKKSLQGICDENNLVFRFRNDTYPITLTINPTGGIGAQISMLESVEEKGYMSADASMVFSFEGGELKTRSYGSFEIREELRSKIKNLYKNMHSLWLQFFNREIVEKGILKVLPRIEQEEICDDEDDAAAPTVTTTVDNSGLVTHVQFSGEDSEYDDAELPEDDMPGEEDSEPPEDDDGAEDDEDYGEEGGDYEYTEPGDNGDADEA